MGGQGPRELCGNGADHYDRAAIAIKSFNPGGNAGNILIRAHGVVRAVLVFTHSWPSRVVLVDWVRTDLDRIVPSHGAAGTIHGPYVRGANP